MWTRVNMAIPYSCKKFRLLLSVSFIIVSLSFHSQDHLMVTGSQASHIPITRQKKGARKAHTKGAHCYFLRNLFRILYVVFF
jgi:hypothetical protein